eukprot:CAMPEP_0194131372 /NCGR_PEP_ID=MMETSP0152-20130528/2166_1 /TAXON_ID=1049557 /ORGANISM="Thalassiothrix antarctica, Strain L6-D1" /LENGTH=210 /DNA_ID=CAMNT_0038826141 /DNA_START=69 /DNA_END=701 /DNA_ORIENTATION=+
MAEANTPAWLSGPNEGGKTTTVASNSGDQIDDGIVTVDITAKSDAKAPNGEGGNEKDLPGIILFMRLANMGVSIALIVISILNLIGLSFSLSTLVLAVYATCGGLLICCLETQLKFLRVMIAVNFGFLFNSVWRFLFYILLASVTLAYRTLFGYITSIALVVTAVMNTYILCRYPAYRKMREKIAEEEDKRIESRISKEVKRQAITHTLG